MPSLKQQPPLRARPRAGSRNHARRLDPVSQASCVASSRRNCSKRQHQTQIELQNLNRHFDSNQQYSITAVSDGGGTVVERYAYSAYGQVTIADASGSVISISAIANRYTYTGREWDEGLSLYHYRARMYDAVSGRFISRDPIGYAGIQWNLFQFLFGNISAFVDPDGRSPQIPGPVPPGAKADGNTPCGLLFSWKLPDPTNPPTISENVKKYLKCVLERVLQGEPKYGAAKDCAHHLGEEKIDEFKDGTLDWLVSSYCCEERRQRGKTKDPCEHGTQDGDPLGRPRPCWTPNNRAVKKPNECFECCDFLNCSENLKAILSSASLAGLIKNITGKGKFDFIECQEACGAAGNQAR